MSEKQRMWKLAGQYSSVGVEMAICVGLSVWLGMWVDEKLGTDPGFSLFGFVVGVGAATKAVIRVTRRFQRHTAAQDQSSADESELVPDDSEHRDEQP